MNEIRYYIAESGDPEKLAQIVQDKLSNGWSLQGGVCVTSVGDDFFLYVQAVIHTRTASAGAVAGGSNE